MNTNANANAMKIEVTVTATFCHGLGPSKLTVAPGGGCMAGVELNTAGSIRKDRGMIPAVGGEDAKDRSFTFFKGS